MTASVQIDASKLHALIGRFANAEPVMERHADEAGVRSAGAVHADAVDNAPVDQGHLRRSIAVQLRPGEAAIGTNLSYALPVEVGRAPGAKMPPQGVLLEWMRRHGIPADREFVLRRSIARRGIRPQPYLEPALVGNKAAMQREFDLAAERALAELTA